MRTSGHGFPRSYTARSNSESLEWRREFVRTFLERDLPQLGISIPAATLERFWAMLAHYHGQVWNASELGRSFGVYHHVMRRYLDALQSTFMIRTLRPWAANSGVLHTFLECTINFFGFTDGYFWPIFLNRDPLMFDANYAPKPAFFGVRDALVGY